MKKFLSIVLCVALLAGSVSVIGNAAADMEMSFAVAADLHIAVPEEELTVSNDSLLYPHANRRTALQNESSFILKSFLEQCANDKDVEFVLIPGDLANDGRHNPKEHELTAQILREFEQSSGKQVYVINGNHDIGPNLPYTYEMFKENYAEFGYDLALETREEDCSYTANLGKKYRLIALDSCDHNVKTADGLTEDRLQWALEQADKAKADGRYPILMMHHNLLPHMPIQNIIYKAFIVKDYKSVAEKLANKGVQIVLTGHEHCSDATTFTSSKGYQITDFANTSLSMYPVEYRLFYMSEYEIRYMAQEVQGIDTAALSAAVKGYTPEMLEAMDSDLNGYSRGFLKQGVSVLVKELFTPDLLGFQEGDDGYELISNAINKIQDILDMKLYGEGSIEEMGKKYNIEIPQTSYETGYDAVSEIVALHYAGEENYTYQSPEVLIFLRMLAIIFREEAQVITGKEYEGAADTILENTGAMEHADMLTEMGQWAYGNITPLEYFLLALVSPIVLGFVYDDDGVNDNNGYLPAYDSMGTSGRLDNMGNNFTSFFTDFIKMFENFIMFISKALGAL